MVTDWKQNKQARNQERKEDFIINGCWILLKIFSESIDAIIWLSTISLLIWYITLIDLHIWENGIETCILSYVKWIASPGSMHDTGCLGLVHRDDPEGWDREAGSGWGTYVHSWQIHANVWQNQYNIVK